MRPLSFYFADIERSREAPPAEDGVVPVSGRSAFKVHEPINFAPLEHTENIRYNVAIRLWSSTGLED